MRFDACCAVQDAKRGSYDPTGLTVPRRRFEREMIRRFTELKRAIRAAVVTLDVLGLRNPGNAQSLSFVKTFAPAPLVGDAVTMPAPSAFSYGRASEKVSSFMEWLYQAEQEGILEVMTGTPLEMAASSAWQNVYVDTAYQKGMRDAYSKATKKSGAQYVQSAFNQPAGNHAAREADQQPKKCPPAGEKGRCGAIGVQTWLAKVNMKPHCRPGQCPRQRPAEL